MAFLDWITSDESNVILLYIHVLNHRFFFSKDRFRWDGSFAFAMEFCEHRRVQVSLLGERLVVGDIRHRFPQVFVGDPAHPMTRFSGFHWPMVGQFSSPKGSGSSKPLPNGPNDFYLEVSNHFDIHPWF